MTKDRCTEWHSVATPLRRDVDYVCKITANLKHYTIEGWPRSATLTAALYFCARLA
jgi:hypothetical protein